MGSMSGSVCMAKARRGEAWRAWKPAALAMAARKVAKAWVAGGEASQPYKALVMALDRMAFALV